MSVDLGAVTFLDACGLSVLIAHHHRAANAGGSLELLRVPPVVRRLLMLTALDLFFVIDPRPAVDAGS